MLRRWLLNLKSLSDSTLTKGSGDDPLFAQDCRWVDTGLVKYALCLYGSYKTEALRGYIPLECKNEKRMVPLTHTDPK